MHVFPSIGAVISSWVSELVKNTRSKAMNILEIGLVLRCCRVVLGVVQFIVGSKETKETRLRSADDWDA